MKNDFYLSDWMIGKLEDQKLVELEGKSNFINYQKIKNLTESISLEIPKSLEWSNFSKKLPQKKSKKTISLSWVYQIAATLIILIGLSTFFLSQKTFSANQEITIIELADGSVAKLAPGSKLSHNRLYGWLNRSVNIEGEIIFNVKKGSPFIVNSLSGTVEVLGTTFKVLDSNDFYEVLCKEGKVKVTFNEENYILQKGSSFNTTEQKIIPFNISLFEVDNQIYYNRVPLSYVIKLVEKTYNLNITFSPFNNHYFTGIIPLNNQESALESITLPFAFILEKTEDGTLIIKEK